MRPLWTSGLVFFASCTVAVAGWIVARYRGGREHHPDDVSVRQFETMRNALRGQS